MSKKLFFASIVLLCSFCSVSVAWTVDEGPKTLSLFPEASKESPSVKTETQGVFEKKASITNKKYVHNIDAKTGFPVSVLKSVSIVSPTAELSDAMATPIMLMGVNAGLYLINQLQQLACVIIDDHDRIYTSKEVNYLT